MKSIFIRRLMGTYTWRHILFAATVDQVPALAPRTDLEFRDCTGTMIARKYRDFFLEFASQTVLARTNLWMVRGRAWFFVTYCGGREAHYTVAYDWRRGRRRFPDIESGGVIFGPCYTRTEFRGRSIYPFTLQRAVHYLASKGIDRFSIDCASKNTASIRGILKSGFTQVGTYEGQTTAMGLFTKSRRISD